MKLTVVTSSKPRTLSKKYWLDSDGNLQKKTVAQMSQGTAQVESVDGLDGLALLLRSLAHNQALVYGLPPFDKIKLLTKKDYESQGRPAGHAPRSKEVFSYPEGPGVFQIDHDPYKGHTPHDQHSLTADVEAVAVGMDDAGKIWWPSSSSFIFNGDKELTSLKGQRLYYGVKNAKDIPRAGNVLVERLWLNGKGWFEISKSGALLERTIVDASVWQTNRLDFAAGAQCVAPLEQRRGDPVVMQGALLDTRLALPDLTPEEQAQVDAIKATARAAMASEANAVKDAFVDMLAAEMVEESDDPTEALKQAVDIARRAVDHNTLAGDFSITLDDQTKITVGELLDDPASYHGRLTLDPLEPDYEGNKVVGKLFLIGSRPRLYSFAHGGRTFRMIRQPRKIELIRGRTHDAVIETLALMRVMPDVYDMGEQLVVVDNGRAQPLDEHRLTHWLGGIAQYWSWRKYRDVLVEELSDPPVKLVKAVLSLNKDRGLKRLDAVITAPVITPTGTVLSKPGYHADARLMLDVTSALPPVPDVPTVEQVKQAYETLMHPFNNFPFCSNLDRAILLSGLLTACVRPILKTAPAVAFDAPVQGSGKTLAASCLAVLATGEQATIWPHTAGRDDEEIRKRIFTAIKDGDRAMIWDNIIGQFDSASIAALLTSENYTDRKLGASERASIPNRALFLMTGNNMSLAGDMPRRVLKCRIDPETDRPYARQFDLDPQQYVMHNRQLLVAAALTIIRGYMATGNGRAVGRMASFEVWDDMVRQPVAWLNRDVVPSELADIMEAVDQSTGTDPDAEALHDALDQLKKEFGHDYFGAKEVYQKIRRTGEFAPDRGDLADALSDLVGRAITSPKSLGRVFKNRTDRRVQGLVLKTSYEAKQKVWRWRVAEA